MSRVTHVEKETAPPEAKEIYDKLESHGAGVMNLYKTMAHNPQVLLAYLRLGAALLTRAKLPARLRELVILRIAKMTGSKYEWTQHLPIALEMGVTAEQAEQVSDWRASKLFSDKERAILQYVEEVAQNIAAGDETFKELRKYLDEQETVELTMSIGHWGMTARFLVALEVDIEERTVGSSQDLVGRKKP